MNMLRHNDITNHLKPIPEPNTIQPILKQISSDRRSEIAMPSKATKSYKMNVPHVLIPLQTNNHHAILLGLRREASNPL